MEQPRPISLWGREKNLCERHETLLVITVSHAFPQISHQIALRNIYWDLKLVIEIMLVKASLIRYQDVLIYLTS